MRAAHIMSSLPAIQACLSVNGPAFPPTISMLTVISAFPSRFLPAAVFTACRCRDDFVRRIGAKKIPPVCTGGISWQWFRLLLEKVVDDFRNALDLLVRQFGIDRQAQAFARRLLGDREAAFLVAERRVAFLHVQRQRIMERA